MIANRKLQYGGVLLRQIELSDCTSSYVEWLNDVRINQFLETRWYEQNLNTIRDFVNSQRENGHSVLFAIIYEDKHIGNIKIGPVNTHHLHADLSYFIGETSYWNRGIATTAINLVCRYGFEDIGLHRIEAGVYADAVGSWKALERNGFIREGTFRKQVIYHDTYSDIYRYGLLKSELKDL